MTASIWSLVHRHALLLVRGHETRLFASPPVAVGGDALAYARELEVLAAAIRAAAVEPPPSSDAP